jgi:hypothetical protein
VTRIDVAGKKRARIRLTGIDSVEEGGLDALVAGDATVELSLGTDTFVVPVALAARGRKLVGR